MTEQSECTICLLDYNEETKTETKCNHTFHTECLDKWLQTNYTCPLCRTELKKDTLCRPIYALPSEQQRLRYNSDLPILDLSIGLEAIMTEPGYNAEDSIVFGRELIDEGIRFGRRTRLSLETLRNMLLETQPQQEQGFTLRRRENVHELREYQRWVIDYLSSQSHPEMLHSGSTGITHVGSPVELNVTYADEVWISQLQEELTQVATDSLSSGGSAVPSSMMQNMGELFDFDALYPSSMTRAELAGEEIISDRYRYPINEYFNNTIEEVD